MAHTGFEPTTMVLAPCSDQLSKIYICVWVGVWVGVGVGVGVCFHVGGYADIQPHSFHPDVRNRKEQGGKEFLVKVL